MPVMGGSLGHGRPGREDVDWTVVGRLSGVDVVGSGTIVRRHGGGTRFGAERLGN